MSSGTYLYVFIISAAATFLFTPFSGALAIKFNALDSPSGRKIHRKAVPLWGRFAVFSGVFLTVFLVKGISSGFYEVLRGDSGSYRMLEGILSGAVFITALGAADDVKSIAPTTKLFGQIIAALIVMQYGIRIEGIQVPFFSVYIRLPVYASILLTVFWMAAFMNSINLLDGLDGLAAGVIAITSLVFFFITLMHFKVQTDPLTLNRLRLVAVISLALCGACAGFLKFNFPPAKIFLGDSGSLLLGYMAGVLTVSGILKTAGVLTLAVPLVLFGVPLWDAFSAFIRRIFRGRHFMEADKEHLHHRLLYRPGWTEKKVALRIYGVTLMLGAAALLINAL